MWYCIDAKFVWNTLGRPEFPKLFDELFYVYYPQSKIRTIGFSGFFVSLCFLFNKYKLNY